MELRHLRYFVAVAEAGTFSRAAARLRITQPALWRQVHDLEGELGVRLFERSGRRVRMTSAGEGLLLRCRDLLADFQQLAEHAQAMRGGEVGKLSIAASPQVIQSQLAPFLTRYLRSRPGIDIHLVEEGGAHTLGLVERGEVQLALAIRRGSDRLSGRLLFPVRVLAAMPSRHRLARRRSIEVSDLQDERVLLLRQGFGTREMFDGACRIAHVHTRIVLEAGDPHSLIALAQAAQGIAIVPSTVWFSDQTIHVVPILHARESLGHLGLGRLGSETVPASIHEEFCRRVGGLQPPPLSGARVRAARATGAAPERGGMTRLHPGITQEVAPNESRRGPKATR